MTTRLVTVLLTVLLLTGAVPLHATQGTVAIHLLGKTSDSLLVELGKSIPDLAERGIDLIFLEVDYSFEFQSHPQLRQGERYITRDGARRLARICRENGIRLIPEFQSLGHQSWAAETFPLLKKYPEFDLTPGAFPENDGIYCREWDPTNPRINQIVFALIDEIVEAFDADGIHIGMDEIFLLDSEHAPNTRDRDPAQLLAQVINEFHDHFVKQKGLQVFMWGDRLIDGTLYPYGEYESSLNGTAAAVDMIPRDIVICDWHYEPMEEYPSIPMFLDKGFSVLPSSYRKLEAVAALIKYSYSLEHPKMLGHLLTTWSNLDAERLLDYPPMLTGMQTIRGGLYFDVTFQVQSVAVGEISVAMAARGGAIDIRFTRDGSAPDAQSDLYETPVVIDASTILKATAFREGEPVSGVRERRFVVHKATGRQIRLASPASTKYPARDGVAALVNGVTGTASYADGQWVGAEGADLQARIDLGHPTEISKISVSSMNNRPNWVFSSRHVEVSGSLDGTTFEKLGEIVDVESDEHVVSLDMTFERIQMRYLDVLIHNQRIPEGFGGAGEPAWLFVDEIIVE